jgi:hypothetical protein
METPMTMIDKDEVARVIVVVSRNHAEGYRRAISSEWRTEQENDVSEKCACAASNMGVFLLQALGYSSDEIRSLIAGQPAGEPK